MKIPKYIEDALNKRAKHADEYMHYDRIVSDWLDKNNIPVEICDYYGGVESVVNPYESIERIKESILKAGGRE